jgi:hypothetical protein
VALGEDNFKRKKTKLLPECLVRSTRARVFKKKKPLPRMFGSRHSGKGILKKGKFFPECLWSDTRGRGFLKKQISSPTVALGEAVSKKKKFLS